MTRLTRVPVYILSSDLSMGLAIIAYNSPLPRCTRLLSKLVFNKVSISVPANQGHRSYSANFRSLEEKQKGFRKDLPTLLFVRRDPAGARVFNEFVTTSSKLLLDTTISSIWRVIQHWIQAGQLVSSGLCNRSVFTMLQKADLVVTKWKPIPWALAAKTSSIYDCTTRKRSQPWRPDWKIPNIFVDKRLCRAIAGRAIDARNL